MSKHTPGPWHHDEYGHICAGPQIIGIAYQFELDDSDHDELPCIPNARLLAAAPEMLRLIQRLTSPYMAEPEYRMDAFIDANEIAKQITQGDD